MDRRTCLLAMASCMLAACESARIAAVPSAAASASSPSAPPTTYAERRARIGRTRIALADDLAAAHGTEARRRVIDRAREALRAAIVDTLLPAWTGTAWAFHGTAQEPGAPGGIACGYFVATILEHAGLRLESRRRFGQATALAIENALVTNTSSHHRYFSVPSAELEKRMRALGDGIYVIGLDVHVGFVVVRGDAVHFVHASYTGDRKVVDEPLASSVAIANSRPSGYFVTALLADDALVLAWLAQTTVAAPSG